MKLTQNEREMLLRIAIAEKHLHKPIHNGEVSVTTRGSEQLAVNTLITKGLVKKNGDIYILTNGGFGTYITFIDNEHRKYTMHR